MQIICISRYSYSYGKELAEKLAAALGYECLAREDITNRATACGIPVGKLETAILKRQFITEELEIETQRFKAFITAELCERARHGGIVYHGRVGHMVMVGVSHILRVRVCANEEDRIQRVIERMNLKYKQAKDYITQVDEDRCSYARFFYNVNCNDPSLFDVIVNTSHLSVDDAVDSLVTLAHLSEFQSTNSSVQKSEDLLLQARCRLALCEDLRTRNIKATIRAVDGNVSITYQPAYEKQSELIPQVLEKIKELKSLVCTMATTNIIYIQERFNSRDKSFQHLIEIAGKWNASVELVRLDHQHKDDSVGEREEIDISLALSPVKNGGILDEATNPDEHEQEDYGKLESFNKLVQVGRAGTVQTIYGGIQPLAKFVENSRGNCLIVLGEVFLTSISAAKKRMKRDLIGLLSDHSRVPVISSDDLQEEYLFGPKQKIKTIGYALVTVLIYFLVFTNQDLVIELLSASGTGFRILIVALIILFVPAAAFIISGLTRNILKLAKLE